MAEEARKILPDLLHAWFDRGRLGVQVFFVISGFVIAYSVRNAWVTPGYLGNYALRRSIRLDPPYWTTILFVLLVHAVFALHLGFVSPLDMPEKMEDPVTWKLLLAHVLYVQNILGFENLSAGFWTLCIEVQFYLLYVTGLGVAQRFPSATKRQASDAGPWALLGLFGSLALLSLFVWHPEVGRELWIGFFQRLNLPWLAGADPSRDFWLTHFFCMFFLGCSAWWALDGRIPAWAFWSYVGLMAARVAFDCGLEFSSALAGGADIGECCSLLATCTLDLKVALVAGIAIYVLGRTGRLGTALDFRPLQYLGKISYSLYLIHFPVAHMVTSLAEVCMDKTETFSPAMANAWLIVALAVSIAAAHVLYRLVEAPSVRLGARLKRKPAGGERQESGVR